MRVKRDNTQPLAQEVISQKLVLAVTLQQAKLSSRCLDVDIVPHTSSMCRLSVKYKLPRGTHAEPRYTVPADPDTYTHALYGLFNHRTVHLCFL